MGNNCVIKNSIILNDVYLGDNTYIENCIVESRDTIKWLNARWNKRDKSGCRKERNFATKISALDRKYSHRRSLIY